MVSGQFLMVNGQWSTVNSQWATVNGQENRCPERWCHRRHAFRLFTLCAPSEATAECRKYSGGVLPGHFPAPALLASPSRIPSGVKHRVRFRSTGRNKYSACRTCRRTSPDRKQFQVACCNEDISVRCHACERVGSNLCQPSL